MPSSAADMVSTSIRVARREGVEDFLDQHFRRRRARGDAERARSAELLPVDIARRAARAPRLAAGAFGDFAQALRVRRIRRADHDHGIDQRRDALDRFLPVGGGVADVFLVRADDLGEALFQRGRRSRRCRRAKAWSASRKRACSRLRGMKDSRVGQRFDEAYRAVGQLPHACRRLPDARHGRSARCRGRA